MESFVEFSKKFWYLYLAAVVVFFGSCAGCTYNKFVRHESGIKASNRDMENVLGAGYKKIESQGLAVDKYKDIFIKALKIGIEGRYGKTGSKAAFLWISEKHPDLDKGVLKALNVAIEATFNRFEAVQRAKIDKVRAYENSLKTFPGNVWAGVFGFPKLDLKKESEVISSDVAKKAMKEKKLSTPKF